MEKKNKKLKEIKEKYENLKRKYDPGLENQYKEQNKKYKDIYKNYATLKRGIDLAKNGLNKLISSYPFIEFEQYSDCQEDDDSNCETGQKRQSSSRASSSRTATTKASTSRATTSNNESRSTHKVNTYKLLINNYYITEILYI